jgi:hypothetical protein
MKNFLLFIALVSFSFASAQITTNAGTFNKPSEGETAFEFQFMPNLDGNAMFADSNMTVMMRQFKSDTKAVRWSAMLDYNNTGNDATANTYGIGIGYGIENHFSGAERLSTYWGYGASLGFSGAGDTEEEISTGEFDDEGNEIFNTVTIDGPDPTISLGANVFLGADYYIMPKVYVGVEMMYGVTIKAQDDTEFGLGGGVSGMMRVGFRL